MQIKGDAHRSPKFFKAAAAAANLHHRVPVIEHRRSNHIEIVLSAFSTRYAVIELVKLQLLSAGHSPVQLRSASLRLAACSVRRRTDDTSASGGAAGARSFAIGESADSGEQRATKAIADDRHVCKRSSPKNVD
jgi:hypothetical protein